MRIGLYFGTFNPIHVGHLIIANHIAEYSDLDEIWMVVTPHNPLKKKKGLLEDYHRLHMVYLATENYPKIRPSDIEFSLPQPNYTINTLAHLEEKFPNNEFVLIMGEDNLMSISKWKNYETILERYPIYTYPRIFKNKAESKINADFSKVIMIEAPIIEISSTYIRESINKGKNVRPLLDAEVFKYIDHNLFYKKF